jgi:hypothetical protein
LHWIPEPGREVYFVINQNLDHALEANLIDREFRTQRTDATVKMNYTFRF